MTSKNRRRWVTTAGERVVIAADPSWVLKLIDECVGETSLDEATIPTVEILVERSRLAFDATGWTQLTRGAWARDQRLMMRNACASGFDVLLDWKADPPRFTYRWRPPAKERAGWRAFPARATLLARAALVHYPSLFVAGLRGRVPLHASAFSTPREAVLLTGTSGAGKSTLVSRELRAGAAIVSDNLCVSDGATVWGLLEPLRSEDGTGRRMPHGRRESTVSGRAEAIDPDRLVVLRRGVARDFVVRACEPSAAARALIGATYMAGELRRYWAFAATCALAMGCEPVHPPVESVARDLASRLACAEVVLPHLGDVRLADLLPQGQEANR